MEKNSRPYGRRKPDTTEKRFERRSSAKPGTRSEKASERPRPARKNGTDNDKPRYARKAARTAPAKATAAKATTAGTTAESASGLVRLNKFIANSGICSRREADTYIGTGLVTVNGVKVTELGSKVDPVRDDIRFNGTRIRGEKKVYIVMNKPKDFVTTMADPHADRTVMELISKSLCPERVFPVGRLDKATTGVLMFTNDGEMAARLTHPRNEVRKIYHATLDKNLRKEDFDKILDGIELEDGPVAADALSYVEGDKTQVGLEIHSGRNRIVRRIFEQLGYKVKKLDRVYFAGLTKRNLRRGAWRFLDEKEINMLKMGAFE